MGIILRFPLLFFLLLAYNFIAGYSAYYYPGLNIMSEPVWSFMLPSGSEWTIVVRDLFITAGLALLYVEIFKSTSASNMQILEHTLSFLVFLIYLMEFLFVPYVSDSAFLMLCIMSSLDLIGGMTISISAARRDLAIRGLS